MDENEALELVDPPGVRQHAQADRAAAATSTKRALVKKLEEEGIGRPSTYAEILSKVQARDYVVKVENKLRRRATSASS